MTGWKGRGRGRHKERLVRLLFARMFSRYRGKETHSVSTLVFRSSTPSGSAIGIRRRERHLEFAKRSPNRRRLSSCHPQEGNRSFSRLIYRKQVPRISHELLSTRRGRRGLTKDSGVNQFRQHLSSPLIQIPLDVVRTSLQIRVGQQSSDRNTFFLPLVPLPFNFQRRNVFLNRLRFSDRFTQEGTSR